MERSSSHETHFRDLSIDVCDWQLHAPVALLPGERPLYTLHEWPSGCIAGLDVVVVDKTFCHTNNVTRICNFYAFIVNKYCCKIWGNQPQQFEILTLTYRRLLVENFFMDFSRRESLKSLNFLYFLNWKLIDLCDLDLLVLNVHT
jgi:hypothetical protein